MGRGADARGFRFRIRRRELADQHAPPLRRAREVDVHRADRFQRPRSAAHDGLERRRRCLCVGMPHFGTTPWQRKGGHLPRKPACASRSAPNASILRGSAIRRGSHDVTSALGFGGERWSAPCRRKVTATIEPQRPDRAQRRNQPKRDGLVDRSRLAFETRVGHTQLVRSAARSKRSQTSHDADALVRRCRVEPVAER